MTTLVKGYRGVKSKYSRRSQVTSLRNKTSSLEILFCTVPPGENVIFGELRENDLLCATRVP